MSELTDDEIRIKVAEACGWRNFTGDRHMYGLIPDGLYRTTLPDYPNDLNACAEFEKTLTKDWHLNGSDYVRYKLAIIHFLNEQDSPLPVECADAKTRCLAFLKVKGLVFFVSASA